MKNKKERVCTCPNVGGAPQTINRTQVVVGTQCTVVRYSTISSMNDGSTISGIFT